VLNSQIPCSRAADLRLTRTASMTTSNHSPPDQAPLRPGDLVDENEAAAILRTAVRTLRNWRALRKGPSYRKIGQRLVRYHRTDLAAFTVGSHPSHT